MYEVSFSELRTWRTCRQLYHYRYVEQLEPRLKALPLKRGSWIHSLLEAYHRGENWREIHEQLTEEFNLLMDEEREYYGSLPQDGEYLMGLYEKAYTHDKPLGVELAFEGFHLSPQISLRGRIDMIVEDSRGAWVVEHKTTSRIPNEDERMLNPQVALYIPVAEELLGVPIIGVLWNYLRTKIPKKKSLDLLERRYMPVNRKIIHQLVTEARIAAVESRGLSMPYRALNPMICRGCQFRSLCTGELMGLDTEFIRKSEYKRREKQDGRGGEEKGEKE
jgi:RecB family exonuclease